VDPHQDGLLSMGFGAWFSTLTPFVKVLVVIGIVVAGFAIGAAFVVSTLGAWKYLAEILGRRDKKGESRDDGPV
jgi:hypothetical protein